jgi:hypothetical protein
MGAMESQTPPPIPSQPKGNWWTRNWKWFVPTGCLTVLILFAAFIALIVMIVFSAMKSSDVYKEALERAKADPAVTEALGSPIKDGLFVSGSTNVNGASGEAKLAIPIYGPKGKATIYVVAKKSAGQWKDTVLAVEIEKTKRRIDLRKTSERSESL